MIVVSEREKLAIFGYGFIISVLIDCFLITPFNVTSHFPHCGL